LFSNGSIRYAGFGSSKIEGDKKLRVKKKFQEISEFEAGLIAASGSIASMVLALILGIFAVPLFTDFASINYLLAAWTMIPIPGFNGGKLFYGSLIGYVITAVLMALAIASINSGNAFGSILLAVIGILSLTYIYKYDLK